MIVHAAPTVSSRTPPAFAGYKCGPGGEENLLRKQDGGGVVLPKTQNIREILVPVKILFKNSLEITGGEGLAGGVQNVEGLVYDLAQFAEAFVNGTDIGRLLIRTVEWCACEWV